MILRQMEQPLKPLYSMKQALEWLIQVCTQLMPFLASVTWPQICWLTNQLSDSMFAVQLASALAHLHSLQPEVPHGRLSTSIIAVTSAAEISLGRCISTLLRQDSTPSSKRMHVVDSTSICSGSLECEPDPLVPEAIRPSRSVPRFLAGPFRRSSAGMSVAFTSCPHSSPQFDALQRRHSVAGPDDSLATYPDSLPLHSRAMFMHRLAAPWRHDTDSIDAAMHALSLQAGGGSAPGGVADKAAVSSTELPGVGTVFKVSVPGMRRNAGESLFEAAEAAVWSRSGVNLPPGLVPLCPTGRVHMNVLACTTMHNHASSHNINVDFPTPRDSPEFADTGSEVKQHGGAFFAKTMSTPLLHNHSATALDVMDDSRRFSEESQEVGGNSPGGNSSATGNTTTRSLDAADTEHILLSCPLMWRKNSERNGQAQAGNVQGQTPCAAPQHMYTTSSTAHVFSRAVARSPLEASSGLACRDWLTHNPRLSEEVLPHSPVDRMCAKRTRSGLSVRLPSLVELPGAEARCAAQDASPDGGSGHAHHRSYCHAGSAPVSVLPGAHIDMAELAAARSAHAGLSQFSMSSPDGVLGAPELMGNSVEEATGDAKFSAGETLAVAIAAAKFSTPVLTRIRQSVVCGERDTQSSAEPAPTPDSTGQGPAQGVAMGVQGRPCVSDQKQRGGLKVLQLLETTQEDMRTKWLQQLLCQRTSSMQEPSQFINTPPRFQNSAGMLHPNAGTDDPPGVSSSWSKFYFRHIVRQDCILHFHGEHVIIASSNCYNQPWCHVANTVQEKVMMISRTLRQRC